MPARGKKRAVSAEAVEGGPQADNDTVDADGSANQTAAKPGRKSRQRKAVGTTGKKTRIKRTLSRLPDMPLDILYEIFGHLGPMDLLNLARTAKAFRRLLMSRSNSSMWKKALEQDPDLPKCPDDLNEVQYTRLVFDCHCFYCGAVVKSAYWASRVRCCKRCFKDHFFDDDTACDVLDGMPHWAGLNHLVLSDESPYQKGQVFLRTAVESAALALKAAGLAKEWDYEEISEWTKYKEERSPTLKAIRENALALQAWQDKVLDRRTQELADIRARRKDAINAKLEAYGLGDEMSHMTESQLLVAQEQKWLKDATELTERRWANIKDTVVDYMQHSRDVRLVTERARQFEHARRKLLIIYNHILSQWIRPGHPLDQLPDFADVCVMPETSEVLDFIVSADKDESTDHIRAQTFQALLITLGRAYDRWLTTSKDALLALMPATSASSLIPAALPVDDQGIECTHALSVTMDATSSGRFCAHSITEQAILDVSSTPLDPRGTDAHHKDTGCSRTHAMPTTVTRKDAQCQTQKEAANRLLLATTWFRCPAHLDEDCNAIDFPRVLWHPCFRLQRSLNLESQLAGVPEPTAVTLGNALVLAGDVCPWNCGKNVVGWDKTSSAAATQIIQACGKDPETATGAEMDELDARLACTVCTEFAGLELEMNRLARLSRLRRTIIKKAEDKDHEVEEHVVAPAYNWRRAILHQLNSKHTAPRWVVFNDVDRQRIADESKVDDWDHGLDNIWRCRLCPASIADFDAPKWSRAELTDHFRQKHERDIDECSAGVEYVKAFHKVNTREDLPRVVWLEDPDTEIPRK